MFGVDIGEVILDGFFAESQTMSDFFVRKAFGNQRKEALFLG